VRWTTQEAAWPHTDLSINQSRCAAHDDTPVTSRCRRVTWHPVTWPYCVQHCCHLAKPDRPTDRAAVSTTQQCMLGICIYTL